MKCKLSQTAEFVCLMGAGPKRTKVMIIGEAPGEREDDSGMPFVGRSGKLLDDLLERAGLSRDSIYTTNAVHCRPPDNRTPNKREIKACNEYLMAEINLVKPKFILTLGNVPLESLLGIKGIKKLRGSPIEHEFDHGLAYIMPTYHPSYALRDPRNEPVIERDVKQFAEIIKRGKPRAEPGLNYKIVNRSNLEEALDDIRDNDIVSLDTETSGLDPFHPDAYVTSLGIGTADYQWCFPLNHRESPLYRKFNAQRRLVRKIVKALEGKEVVGHNMKFDTVWLYRCFGVWVDCTFDTLLCHYLLDENSYHGLDHLASQYYNAPQYDVPLEEKFGFGPLNRHCEYLSLDVFYTRKLRLTLRKELKKDPLTYRLFYELTMPAARLYAKIEKTGIYVDTDKLEEAREYWTELRDSKLKELNGLIPDGRQWKDKKTKQMVTGINWASPAQVAEILFSKLKLNPLDKTPTGNNAVNESVLQRLSDKHPIPKLILEYREAEKNLGTFIEGWSSKLIMDDRLRAKYKLHGTVTGRKSSESPNLMQVPRDKRIRSLISARPGWVLVEVDLSQAELRIVAEMSGDKELKLAYQLGLDLHTLTVQRIFGIMEPSPEQRKKGKIINFSLVYGMWYKKLQLYARDNYGVNFTLPECKNIWKGFFNLYQGLHPWHERQKSFARRNGYVRSLVGRKRRLPDAMRTSSGRFERDALKAAAERQAVNSPVQSLVADWCDAALLGLVEKTDESYFLPVGTVHDANLIEVREDKLEYVLPLIREEMESPTLLKKWGFKISVPMECEIKIGPWSMGEVWNE